MTNTLNGQRQSASASLQADDTQVLLWLLGVADVAIQRRFLQVFEWISVPLGAEIPADPTIAYVVTQGRVRLLCQDADLQREVSAQVLSAGEVWGIDRAFVEGLPYRAIAATTGTQVARIAESQLQEWMTQVPELAERWRSQVELRDRLLFLKTQTPLRGHASHRLAQLAALIQTVSIAVGESLGQMATGHYWLRSGELGTEAEAIAPGTHWTNTHPNLPQWRAQSNLCLYYLPADEWENAVAIVPGLAMLADPAESPPPLQRADGRSAIAPLKRVMPLPTMAAPTPSTPPDRSLQSDGTVAFPKPAGRLRFRLWQAFPFIEQQSSSDCGATCLVMIAQYWGKRLSLNFVRNLADVGRSGATLKNLARAGELMGFQTRPVRATLDPLASHRMPWIAHWEGDHYVVVYRIKGNQVMIADPAMGKKTLTRSQFVKSWSGYAVLLEPTKQLKQVEDTQSQRSLGSFWQLLMPYRGLLMQIILASLLIQVFGLVTPFFTQVILDQVVVSKSLPALHVFSLGLIIFSVWQVGITGVRQYLLDYFSNRLDLTLVSGFISHTLRLPMKFFESRQVGDIITRLQENEKIQSFLIRQAVITWLDASMGIVYFGLMFYYNWQLSLAVLALIPPIVLLTLGATPLLKRFSREMFKESAEQNSLVVEMISGVATVKAAAAEQEVRWRWEDRLVSMLNVQFRGQKLINNLQISSGLINSLASAGLLWLGAMLVIQDQLTIGQFVAFNMIQGHVFGSVMAVVGIWDELQEVLIAVERLNDVFSTPPEETPGRPMLVMPPIQGAVRWEDVSFSYDAGEDRYTLQNLSFEVQPGQTVAIVGRSGSGKSTLIKLLQGMYHPTKGRITVDGHDIRHVSPQSLRSQLGVVPQECFLFSGTILENIQLYRPEYSFDDVVAVAKLAEAHPFIQDLPLGYNTKVGERGANLSGGQRQRIAIARALLGDPAMLILDEATSSLDTESERRFQRNLERITRGRGSDSHQPRTTFIIAHRLSTVQHADQILVVDRGILVEQGNHEALIAQKGLYYHLAQQQLNL